MNDLWKSSLKSDPTEWLLTGNPWTELNTFIDLMDYDKESDEVLSAKAKVRSHPLVQNLIEETGRWFDELPKRHDDPKMSHYRLKMLADMGFSLDDDQIDPLMKKAAAHREEGLYAIRQELPERGKPSSDRQKDQWHALPCDSPLLTTALYRLGLRGPEMDESLKILTERWQEKPGWFCHLFFVNSQFKKHESGCMMAGLQTLELLSHLPEPNEQIMENAFAPLEYHRDLDKSLYYFGRSKKFWTMKYPFVWYNALYMADILTRFTQFRERKIVKELIEWIISSQDDKGRFTATSMFRPYKDWDFGNKKEPSPWMTYLCCRILKRYYR